MNIAISTVEQTLAKIILQRSNLTKEEAAILAGDYIAGEMQGKKSHGLAAFPAMAEHLAGMNASFTILKETEAALYVDAQGNHGSIIGRKVADILLEKATHQGIAYAVVRQMKSWLRPAIIAEYIANQNVVGIAMNNGGTPMVVAPGGREPVIGTNPIGISIPAVQPMTLDMATSVRAWGEIGVAKEQQEDLPPDSFINEQGKPTLDPAEAYAALPLGGHKGFGLGLFVEVLCGSLAAMPMGTNSQRGGYRTTTRGAVILAINPGFTVGNDTFVHHNQTLFTAIRSSAPRKSDEKIMLPGDRSLQAKKAAVARGYVNVNKKTWAGITALLA